MPKTKKHIKKKKQQQEFDAVMKATQEIIHTPPRKHIITTIILSIIGGIIGGILYYQTPFKQEPLPQNTQQPVAIPTEELEIPHTMSEVQTLDSTPWYNSVIGIYKKQVSKTTEDNISLTSTYLTDDLIGHGFVLTSDGWIATTQQILEKNKTQNLVAITADKNIYELKNPIIDKVTGTAFFKLDAQNLVVAKFSDNSIIQNLNQIYTVSHNKKYKINTITQIHAFDHNTKTKIYHSSEELYHYINVLTPFETTLIGAPIFTSSGTILGYIQSPEKLLPINYITPVLKHVFKEGKIIRPTLGVTYLNLSELLPESKDYPPRGALLINNKTLNLSAVKPESPAIKKLQANDVILKVDSEEVNEMHSLSELIQEYPINSTLSLTILRDDIEQNIQVTLK